MPESEPRRRILELIAAAPGAGVSQQRLLSQRANASHLADLVDEGLVVATSERLVSGWSRGIGVILTLTDAGRSALDAS